jgi:hypothetical protein
MNYAAIFVHDPQAVLDYTIDWSSWLDADTITAVSWAVPSGLTLASSSFSTTAATAWISGGTLGASYLVTCHITTTNGRQDDRTIRLNCSNR